MDVFLLIRFVLGILLLVSGAELLVRGASRLAAAWGISPLVIGLTVVAFGTSAPELAVSVQAGLAGQPDIVFGNVVGSNIFNVLFILGVSALVAPLVVSAQLVRLDVPLMIVISAALWLMVLDGRVGLIDSLLLCGGIATYTTLLIRASRRDESSRNAAETPAGQTAREAAAGHTAVDLLRVGVGLAMLVLGSRWLVAGAVALARTFGVSELIIGLTVVAAGTSLPEVATSVLATVRGERDIAVGNVIGSNIFNILGILGISGLITGGGLIAAPAVIGFDVPVMTAVAVACLPVFFSGHRIGRREGLLFLSYYLAYTTYLILKATEHDALPVFGSVMLMFVLPLTAATLLLTGLNAWRAQRRDGPRPSA
jgi:cation:H+ antiporter